MSKKKGQYILSAVIILVVIVSLGIGRPTSTILWQLRMPRVIAAILIGAMLAWSALIFQTTLRANYLDGSMLGLANGSEFAVATSLVLLPNLAPYRVLLGAFFGILVVSILRYSVLSIFKQPLLLILVGLSLAMFFNAATTIITANNGFIGKSLSTITWIDVVSLFIIMLIGWLIWCWYSDKLTYYAIPSLQGKQLGFNESKVSFWLQIMAAMWLGAVTAIIGTVFFVGLVWVQIFTLTKALSLKERLGLTTLTGILLTVLADLLAHWVMAPDELPTNAVLLIISAPLLIWIMVRWRNEI